MKMKKTRKRQGRNRNDDNFGTTMGNMNQLQNEPLEYQPWPLNSHPVPLPLPQAHDYPMPASYPGQYFYDLPTELPRVPPIIPSQVERLASHIPPRVPLHNSNPNQFHGEPYGYGQGGGFSQPRIGMPNPIGTGRPSTAAATLESVHEKLDRFLMEQQHHISSASFNPPIITTNFPNVQVASRQSSDEICTLFPSTPPSGGRPGVAGTGVAIPNPIGVFWDIENCQIPRGRSGLVAVKRIREKFFSNYTEAEFVCVCDIRKESPQIIQELNDAQVNIIHVSGNSKNAADDKLRQAMRRFADTYTASSSCTGSGTSNCSVSALHQHQPAIILISGDINFASDLSDLRHRKRLYVILLHNKHAPEALILCAHEHYDFHTLLDNLPERPGFSKDIVDQKKGSLPLKGGHCPMDVLVADLPQTRNLAKLKNRLKKLCDNTGGKVITIQGQFACLRFPNKEAALRASKRMNGEDVFGSKIRVLYSSQMEFTPTANNPQPSSSAQGQGLLGVAPIQVPLAVSQSQYQTVQNGPWANQQKTNWEQLPVATASEYQGFNNNTIGNLKTQEQLITDSSNSHSAGSQPSSLTSRDSSRDPSPCALIAAGAQVPKTETFDIHVTNIDPSLGDWKSVRQALLTTFSEHVMVRAIWVYSGQDAMSAVVRVDTKEDARIAVAQLHRRKIGNKRITISFDEGVSVDHITLKREVAGILLEVPNQSLPLLKFREMFEKRYRRSISSSDLYKMKDVITIVDNSSSNSSGSGSGGSSLFTNTGRTIMLCKDWKATTGNGNVGVYCELHPPALFGSERGRTVGWAEREANANLPNVVVELSTLAERTRSLLESHNGSFPLLSFLDCYEAEFGTITKVEDGQGVPLEHLISCIHGVELAYGDNGMKKVQWHEKKEYQFGFQNTLVSQVSQLARELVDLLKTFPRCSIQFSKLIPAYHHHFGRQCRVADYGHTSLLTLLQTLPSTIQVIGEGHQRVITLAHRAQMKRFTTDVLRVLKAQPGLRKQIFVSEFPRGFNQIFPNRTFVPEDYGLCFLEDLIHELVENSSLVSMILDEEGRTVLIIPKREQSSQEAHRTKIFATEVIELLAHSIRCELPFSKFIPSYHHHYGRQCRVSDYGFSKLAELFEAISDIAEVVSPISGTSDSNPEDKIIRLSPKEHIKVVGEQIWNLVKKRKDIDLPTYIDELEDIFLLENGFALRVDLCKSKDVPSLIRDQLGSYVYLDGNQIMAIDRFKTDELARDTRNILESQPSCSMDENQFISIMNQKYKQPVDITSIERELAHMVIVSENDETKTKQISLAPLRVFAREMNELLEECGGYLPILNIENAYMQKFGRQLRPQQLGYPSLLTLLQAIPEVASLRGKSRTKRILVLNKSNSKSYGDRYSATTNNGFHNYGNNNYNNHHHHHQYHHHHHNNSSGSAGGNAHYNNNHHNHYHNGSKNERHRPTPLSYTYAPNSQQIPNYQQHQIQVPTGGYTTGPPGHEQLQMATTHWNSGPPQQIQPLMVASPAAFQTQAGDTNIFNFEQPTALTSPVYDMWMDPVQVGNGSTPPISPTAVVWTYHPVCYPSPTTPGSPNILIPNFSFSPWNQASGNQQMPTVMGNCFESQPQPLIQQK